MKKMKYWWKEILFLELLFTLFVFDFACANSEESFFSKLVEVNRKVKNNGDEIEECKNGLNELKSIFEEKINQLIASDERKSIEIESFKTQVRIVTVMKFSLRPCLAESHSSIKKKKKQKQDETLK